MNHSNDNIAKLIKEGRYKDVIKYLDSDNIIDNIDNPNRSTIKEKEDDQSFISDYNEANLEQLGYDKELIERLQNLNKINKELLLHKEYPESDVDKTVYLLNNFNELEISDFSKLDKDFNESKAKHDRNQSKLEDLSADKDDDFNILFRNNDNSLQCLHVEKTGLDERGDLISPEDNGKEIIFNLEKLLKEDEKNSYQIMELKENISMQNEEIYGEYFRKIERAKRFPKKNLKIKKFSDLFSTSKLFTKKFSHVSIISGAKQFKENFLSSAVENNKEDEKISINFADFSDIDLEKVQVIKQIKIEQSKSQNHHYQCELIDLGKNFLKVKEIFEKINSSHRKKSNISKINELSMQKIYNNFVTNQDRFNLSNSNKENVDEKIHPVHLKFLSSDNGEQIRLEKEKEKLFERIKHWNKNFSADSSHQFNIPSEINLNGFNNFFINSYTRNNQSDFNKLNNANEINLLEINLNSKNFTKIERKFFVNCENLISISLEDNHLTKMENFQDCKNLITLNLNKNKISTIENLSQNKNLEKLFLNGNQIQRIENLHMNKKLKSLSLGRNKINSIAEIEIQLPFIEDLTLCENMIKNIPEDFSLPFLKYFDLNDNKISFLNLFLCPNLEKLFLKDNKIKLFSFTDENLHTSNSLKFCPKIKELDLSFNKIENFSDLLTYIRYNKNLEVLNLNNNPFSINLKGIIKIEKILIKIFPQLKTIDNEITKKDFDIKNFHSRVLLFKRENSKFSHWLISFFNMFNIQHQFMKYFNSVYHVNNIYNRFNFNSNSAEKFSLRFLNMINENYFLSKLTHLKILPEFLKDSKILRNVLPNISLIQNTLMKYLYNFKHRMEHVLNSLQFFKILMKKKKVKKVKKLQRYFRAYKYFKNLKHKLKNVEFDFEEETNDELLLLNFFNREKLRSGKEIILDKINTEESFFRKIDNKIQSNEGLNIEHVERVDTNYDFTKLDTVTQNISEDKLEMNYMNVPNENSTHIKFSDKIKDIEINHIQSNLEEKIKNLQKKIKSGENNFKANINSFTNPIDGNYQNISSSKLSARLKPREHNKIERINIVNGLDCAEFPKISPLPNVNSLQSQLIKKIQNEEILKKNSLKENIILPVITSTPINIQKPHTIVNDISPHKSHDSISIKSYSKVSNSIQADHLQAESKKFFMNKNSFLPTKLQEQIRLIEQECKNAIKNAKEEWKFNNTQTEELLCNKIRKKYKKMIEKLIHGIS